MTNKNGKVTIIFQTENHIQIPLEYDSDTTIGDVIKKYSSNNNINLEEYYFLINEKEITNSEFNKSLSEFKNKLNAGPLIIFVRKHYNNSIKAKNRKVEIIFTTENQSSTKLQCDSNTTIEEIIKKYFLTKYYFKVNANTITKSDLCKTLSEFMNKDNKDYIKISLIPKNEDIPMEIDYDLEYEDLSNYNLRLPNKGFIRPSFRNNNWKIFLITVIIIIGIGIIAFFILLFVVLRKKDNIVPNDNIKETDKIDKADETNKEETYKTEETDKAHETDKTEKTYKTEETDKTDEIFKTYETDKTEETNKIDIKKKCNDRCLICNNSTSIEECISCNIGFDLYKGECIIYAFKIKYLVDYYYEKIKLFNPEKINNLYAIKIEDTVKNPVSEYNFNNIQKNDVYFYLYENSSTSLSNMFENITKIIDFSFNSLSINNFTIINMKGMFSGCTSLKTISFYPFIGQYISDISYLFSYCNSLTSVNLSNFNSNSLKYINNLFYNCSSLINVDISNFNSDVLNMSSIFYNCELLKSVNLTNFNTQNTIDMSSMFYNCKSLKSINLNNFKIQNVRKLNDMFYNYILLTSLDLINFDTHNVIDMSGMFYNCISLKSLNLKYFNVLNVINMSSMFSSCISLTSLDLSNFYTQNVTSMNYMFRYCKSLTSLDLSNFITQNVISNEVYVL